jgi:hypothetical protein
MRKLVLAALIVGAGCGGSNGSSNNYVAGFTPLPLAADEVQIVSPIVKTLMPGTDITLCSYLSTKLTDTTDVIGARGVQSAGGHHALLYTARSAQPVDTHPCNEMDMTNVTYVAGVGADKSFTGLASLPAGLAFRIPAGAQLMVQTHWINATGKVLDGQAAFNLKVAAPSSARQPADLFSVVDTQFSVAPGQRGVDSTACKVPSDTTLFLLGGHEHKLGTHFRAEHVAGDGSSSVVYERDWVPEYEFNPPMNIYGVDAPLTIKAGDSLKVTCAWDNTTGATDLTFPHDMCVAWGFYFPGHGEIDCVDSIWPAGM